MGEFLHFRKKKFTKFCGLIRRAMKELKEADQIEKSKFLNTYISNEFKSLQSTKAGDEIVMEQDSKHSNRLSEAFKIAKGLESDLDFNRA